MSKGWIGVDFDGTLAYYDEWRGPLHLGTPIPKMVEQVKEWLAQNIEVRIVTARVCTGKDDRDVEEVRKAIEDWCELHIGVRLPVTNMKDFGMIELWDDRAIQVVPNSGLSLTGLLDAEIDRLRAALEKHQED